MPLICHLFTVLYSTSIKVSYCRQKGVSWLKMIFWVRWEIVENEAELLAFAERMRGEVGLELHGIVAEDVSGHPAIPSCSVQFVWDRHFFCSCHVTILNLRICMKLVMLPLRRLKYVLAALQHCIVCLCFWQDHSRQQ